jgi:hypothetical protein
MLQSIISPKLADEIINYPSGYVAFCPDCLTVKNMSTSLYLHDIMDIDSDTAKHMCGDCKAGIVSELLLPKDITDELVNVLINIPDAEVPPSFYTEELLYPVEVERILWSRSTSS